MAAWLAGRRCIEIDEAIGRLVVDVVSSFRSKWRPDSETKGISYLIGSNGIFQQGDIPFHAARLTEFEQIATLCGG
jgi:hypothetical protein